MTEPRPILGIDGDVLLDAPPPEMSRKLIARLLDGHATCSNEYVGYAIKAWKYAGLHGERLKRRARSTLETLELFGLRPKSLKRAGEGELSLEPHRRAAAPGEAKCLALD